MIIRDYLICLLQMYLLEDLEKNILPYRRERFWEKFLVYCIAALAMFGTNRLESSILNMVMIPVIYMIASMVVFRGNIWKKLVTVCCYYVLAIIPEFLFAALTNAYGVTGASEGFRTETEKTLALLLMSTMTFLFIKCINQVTRKRDYLTIENKTFTVLLMLPTATIVMLGCMFYSHTSFEGMNRVMVPVGASLLLMTNIFIFTVFDRFVEKSEEVKKMDRLYQKSRAEIANLQYMNKVNEDNRAFLHDINKFICTVAGLIEEGENQEVKDIMEHLGVRIQNLQKSVYCEHPILNSILCERKFLAESKDISYRITLGNDLRLDFLEELDLISIVGNLLDNALEAAEKTEDGRYVECRMYMGNAGHFLVMEFCNDLEEAVRKVVYGPYALWGHSMGGKISYELEKRLEAAGYTAKCLFISGSRVPSIPEPNPIYHLPDEAFKRELGRFEGTPKEILENQELLDFFLPMLRADFTMDETYYDKAGVVLHTPISAFGGEKDDEADESAILEWGKYTDNDFNYRIFPGGHFYLRDCEDEVISEVMRLL